MATSDIIALALIVAVIIAALVYLIIKYNGKNSRVRSILKSHPDRVVVLLDCENVPPVSSISDEQIEILLSLSDADWDEWQHLVTKGLWLTETYPLTLDEYISNFFPKCKERKNFKKRVTPFTPIPQRVKVAVESLLLDELRLIDADSENVWKKRDDLRVFASKIRQKYPEGYKTYCDIHKVRTPKDSEVVNNKKHIAELQKLYNNSKGYEGWEKKQEDFCSKFWQILKDVRSQDGRYTYDITFNKPTRKGTIIESKFKIWQGFCESFSSCLLEKQTESYLERYKKLEKLKNRNWYFYDHVYEEILDIVSRFNESIDGDVYMCLVDQSSFNWPESSYNYHYRHIRDLVHDSEINSFNISELPSVEDTGNIGGIFIFGFITTNEDLKNNCRFIIEHFRKSVPLLGYYSMEKEHDEKELIELSKKHEGYLSSEENDIEFIKNSLLQVKKHSFFSYIAIPNTWIGEAGQAEPAKRTWLKNPEMYDFKTKDQKGRISGEYSIDGGMNYEGISIEGDGFNVDDTAKFTYLLFKKMGVLARFKKEGHKAIEFMNEHNVLTHHW